MIDFNSEREHFWLFLSKKEFFGRKKAFEHINVQKPYMQLLIFRFVPNTIPTPMSPFYINRH